MIRHNITDIFCLGKLGNLFIEHNVIKADHQFKVFQSKNEIWVLGYTEWPFVEGPDDDETIVQSLYETKQVFSVRGKGNKQGPIFHDQCSPSTTSFDIGNLVFQVSSIELNGFDLNLKKFDLRHFNRSIPIDTKLSISKNARLQCSLNVTRLNAVVVDSGRIETKVESRNQAGEIVTVRWQIDRLKLTLGGYGVVVGIRVNVQLILNILKITDKLSCACDLIANNACKLQYRSDYVSDTSKIRVLRCVDNNIMPQPPPSAPPSRLAPPSSSSSSSSRQIYSDDDDNDSDSDDGMYERYTEEHVNKLFDPNKGLRFDVQLNISDGVMDIVAKRSDEDVCCGCLVNRALVQSTPCMCHFSCLNCLPLFQKTTNNCPRCKMSIKFAGFSTAAYNIPRESFQLTGPPSRDVPSADAPDAPICAKCYLKVAQVILSCSHKSLCLSCAQYMQGGPKPACPMTTCQQPVVFGVVVPHV